MCLNGHAYVLHYVLILFELSIISFPFWQHLSQNIPTGLELEFGHPSLRAVRLLIRYL